MTRRPPLPLMALSVFVVVLAAVTTLAAWEALFVCDPGWLPCEVNP